MWLDSQVGRLQNGMYFPHPQPFAVMLPFPLVSISSKLLGSGGCGGAVLSSLASLTFPLDRISESQELLLWSCVLGALHGAGPDAARCEGRDVVLALKEFKLIKPSSGF